MKDATEKCPLECGKKYTIFYFFRRGMSSHELDEQLADQHGVGLHHLVPLFRDHELILVLSQLVKASVPRIKSNTNNCYFSFGMLRFDFFLYLIALLSCR